MMFPPINLWTVPYARIRPAKLKEKEEVELDERLRARAENDRRRIRLYGSRSKN